MQTPRHSPGESSTQPSTPCSASIEWGGRRSILAGPVVAALWRRVFFKSGDTPPASVSTESIMSLGDLNRCARQTQLGKTCEQPSTACSPGRVSNPGRQKKQASSNDLPARAKFFAKLLDAFLNLRFTRRPFFLRLGFVGRDFPGFFRGSLPSPGRRSFGPGFGPARLGRFRRPRGALDADL